MPIDAATLEYLLAAGWVQVLRALGVAIVAILGLRLALNWTSRAMRRARIDTGTQILVVRGVIVTWLVITTLLVLGILGVNPAGLVAVAGAVGLAFSLAIQDILKNFFAGVYLLLERPFRVGDSIQVKDQRGVVENIGVRTTMLRTAEDVQILVPNAIVFAEVVQNHTYARPKPPQPDPAAGTEAASDLASARNR